MSDEAGRAAASPAAWLVTGEDASLLSEAVTKLVRELVGASDRSLVVEDFSGDEVDVAAVASACSTPPFLADRRVVVLREAGRFGTEQLEPLLSYLKEPLSTTKLVIAGGGGTLPAKFVSAFKAAPGTVLVSTDVTSREAHNWVTDRIARAQSLWRQRLPLKSNRTWAKTSTGSGPCWPRSKRRTAPERRSAWTNSNRTWDSLVRCRPGT